MSLNTFCVPPKQLVPGTTDSTGSSLWACKWTETIKCSEWTLLLWAKEQRDVAEDGSIPASRRSRAHVWEKKGEQWNYCCCLSDLISVIAPVPVQRLRVPEGIFTSMLFVYINAGGICGGREVTIMDFQKTGLGLKQKTGLLYSSRYKKRAEKLSFFFVFVFFSKRVATENLRCCRELLFFLLFPDPHPDH